MKIVIPYVQLHPKTEAAVLAAADELDEIVWADVSDSDSAYFQLLQKHWLIGETFVNLEHDKVPVPGALREIYDCEFQWCSYPHYAAQGPWIAELPTLGCTKFGAGVMAKHPDLLERAGRLDVGLGGFHWQRLDMMISAGLLWALGSCHTHEAGRLDHHHQGEAVSVPIRPS